MTIDANDTKDQFGFTANDYLETMRLFSPAFAVAITERAQATAANLLFGRGIPSTPVDVLTTVVAAMKLAIAWAVLADHIDINPENLAMPEPAPVVPAAKSFDDRPLPFGQYL